MAHAAPRFGFIAPIAALLGVAGTACVVESSPRRSYIEPEAPPAASSPARVDIETGKTLIAAPGDGAGVFVTYGTGGRWGITWTCDSNATRQDCVFDVAVRALTLGSVEAVPRNAAVSVDSSSVTLRTRTAATLDGVTFRTPAGASIVLSVNINGRPTPSLVFFVSGGVRATAPTDPIELIPSSP